MPKRADETQRQLKRATRAAYGATLVELISAGVPVVAVDADLTGSTTTKKIADAGFSERLFNCGIAEQNMVDVAAGLATTGYIAFTGSFAVFGTGRAYDQIRNTVCYGNLNVKIAPTHAGISVGPDGGSHQMLEDISLMRGLPGMRVIVPADYAAAARAIKIAATTPGPVYVRMGRAAVPAIYADDVELELGRAYVLREGSDATVVACGVEVNEALSAAEALAQEGISVEVIDAFSIKPLDVDTVLSSVAKTGCAVVAEEHSVYGGLGSAVAEILVQHESPAQDGASVQHESPAQHEPLAQHESPAQDGAPISHGESAQCVQSAQSASHTLGTPIPVEFVGMRDSFGKSGGFEELSAFFGLDAAAIAEAVKSAIARKGLC